MIAEVLEKYSKDVFCIPVWEWLGITQVAWSVQKKNGLSKHTNNKINTHFEFSDDVDEFSKVKQLTDLYYKIVR